MKIYIATNSSHEPYVQSVIDHLKRNGYSILLFNPKGLTKPETFAIKNWNIPTVQERAMEDKVLIENSDVVIMVFPYTSTSDYIKSFYALGIGKTVIALCDYSFQNKVKDSGKALLPIWVNNLSTILWTIRDLDPYLENLKI